MPELNRFFVRRVSETKGTEYALFDDYNLNWVEKKFADTFTRGEAWGICLAIRADYVRANREEQIWVV